MELDLQSSFGLYEHSFIHWLRPRNPPTPAFGLIPYTRALLVSQGRIHLLVTPLIANKFFKTRTFHGKPPPRTLVTGCL
jgi:hypothetical protein